jgi:hypothetical protein
MAFRCVQWTLTWKYRNEEELVCKIKFSLHMLNECIFSLHKFTILQNTFNISIKLQYKMLCEENA